MNTQKIIEKEWAISKLIACKNDAERKEQAEIAKRKAMIELFRDVIHHCRQNPEKELDALCVNDYGCCGVFGVRLVCRNIDNT